MADREKVMEALRQCASDKGCDECPYRVDDWYICRMTLAEDALTLLEEQERTCPS